VAGPESIPPEVREATIQVPALVEKGEETRFDVLHSGYNLLFGHRLDDVEQTYVLLVQDYVVRLEAYGV